jgi:hypothetical protein
MLQRWRVGAASAIVVGGDREKKEERGKRGKRA